MRALRFIGLSLASVTAPFAPPPPPSSDESASAASRSAPAAPNAPRLNAALATLDSTRPSSPRAGESAEAPNAPVDLFPDAVLREHAGVSPGFGGTTRRAGDGRPPPGGRDLAADGAEAAARIRRWTGELGGELDARAGRVAPVWRDVERQIDAGFHPSAGAITDDNVMQSLARQWRNARPEGGNTPRAADPSRDAEPARARADQIAACQRAYAQPSEWRRSEIEVVVGATGELVDAAVALGSGRAALDRLALDAVRRAIRLRPVRDPNGQVRARWAVESAVAVDPPTVNPIVDPVSNKLIGVALPLLSFRFDESLGTIGVSHPFRREVRTRVNLLSVEKVAPEPPDQGAIDGGSASGG